jgi:hypothetical protein
MKKIILLVAVLLGLILAVYFLWPKGTGYNDTFATTEHTQFAVDKPQEVLSRIFLVDRAGNQALFERQKDNSWLYTNKATGKTYRPAPNAFHNMMETLQNIRARNKVSNASVKSVLRGIATIGIKVELYDLKNKLIRTYYVGGPADGGQGTFAIVDGAEIPYVVYIPHFTGSIDTRYTAKEINLRDKAFVRENAKDIEMVQVEYFDPMQRPYSFKIEQKGNTSEIEPLYVSKSEAKVKKDHIDIYLKDFETIAAEAIIYEPTIRDSILKTSPFAKVSYKTKKSDTPISFTLFPLFNPNFDRGDGSPGLRQRITRYYIDAGEDNFMLGQELVIQKLLRPYDFFLEQ